MISPKYQKFGTDQVCVITVLYEKLRQYEKRMQHMGRGTALLCLPNLYLSQTLFELGLHQREQGSSRKFN